MMYMIDKAPDLFVLGTDYSYKAYENQDEIEVIQDCRVVKIKAWTKWLTLVAPLYLIKVYFCYLAFKYYTEGRRFQGARQTAQETEVKGDGDKQKSLEMTKVDNLKSQPQDATPSDLKVQSLTDAPNQKIQVQNVDESQDKG